MRWLYLLLLSVFQLSTIAQSPEIERLEPPNWWVGMEYSDIQLLVYGHDIGLTDKVSVKYGGVKLRSIEKVENSNYIFLNLEIGKRAKPGIAHIVFEKDGTEMVRNFPLLARKEDPSEHNGFNASDVLYLLMPDRFANGDSSNDQIPGMLEQIDRSNLYGRHGGDLSGVIDHLDYIDELGVTALWLNPVQENDMPVESYHGYAITDFYNVDTRLGDNKTYAALVDEAHNRGLKVIMDMVVNHAGTNHWFIKDLPMADWIHQHDTFTRSNYRGVMNNDPYVAESDFELMKNGWFDHTMADLNQQNPYLAQYLIQHSLWWIEFAGLDGIRMDTWSYPDKHFLSDWAKTVFDEYPDFNIVAEVWENKTATQSYWLKDFDSGIHCLTDFVLQEALAKAFTEEKGWHTGLSRIYYTLTEDRLYPDANDLMIFLDNHDVQRYYSTVNEDIRKHKMGLAVLMTIRGIPQVYYGTELALSGHSHGEVRPEFYGGWQDHPKNAFSGEGLTDEENDLMNYTRKLLQWRQGASVIHTGRLMHFVPREEVYVYFRYDDDHCVMVVLNNNEEAVELETERFSERLTGYKKGRDVVDGVTLDLRTIHVPAVSALIIELLP